MAVKIRLRRMGTHKKHIFRLIVTFPKITLGFFIIASVILGFGSAKLEIDASSESLLLENDKDLQIWRDVSKRYATPNFLIIAFSPKDDLFSEKNLNKIRKISSEIEKFDFVEDVLNITNVPLLLNKKQPITELVKHVPTLNDKDVNLSAAKEEFKINPFYASNLVSKDFKTTAIVINLKQNFTYENFQKKRANLEQNLTTNEQKIALDKLNSEFKIYRDTVRLQGTKRSFSAT